MKSLLLISEIAGGVLLFLFGMQMLGGALRATAGERLRNLLAGATRSAWRGLLLGTSVGALVHSSAATVMTVGFVHAGLLSLLGALPVVYGANIGTTLSMQLVSLSLTDYALAMVALGGLVCLVVKDPRLKTVGEGLLGLGLLFLGMKISGDAIEPHREALAPFLAGIDGSRLGGLLLGTLIAAGITAIVQTSGAVIGMAFVLAGTGVLGNLAQTYPIVLGAHIGTTITALLASIGTSAGARATAIANTLFNVFNAVLGIAGARLLIPMLEGTSGDVVHQTANAHTAIMVIGTVFALPFTRISARLLKQTITSGEPDRPGSYLEAAKLKMPEDALVAVVRELGRCIDLCCESFGIVNRAFRSGLGKDLGRVTRNETSVNEIKASTRAYLHKLARGYLSRRQALMVRALDRCVLEIERIGDHINRLAYLVRSDGGGILSQLDETTAKSVSQLAGMAAEVVSRLARSFQSDRFDFDATSWVVLEARSAYARQNAPVRAEVDERLSRHEVPARLVLAFGEYAVALDRIVRHCAVIAQEQRQPAFAIKESKLGRLAGPHAPQAGAE